MTARAKMKRMDEPPESRIAATNRSPKPRGKAANQQQQQQQPQPAYKLIPWKDLRPSPTNPRKRFNEEPIESLAESIRSQGILEPLTVRRSGDGFEIACGERRYRAAEIAKLAELPCLVRELTDEQVLDVQIHENLHREDLHPMDEACGYEFLQRKLRCDTKELALRVGKSEGYVLGRLKLNSLIKEAQEDVDAGHLPLVYALEIAKHPAEVQELIYGVVYRTVTKYKDGTYVQVPVKGDTLPWRSFLQWINTNVHHSLSKAPFSPKATNLREDGLACVNCPDRTGAAAGLFEPDQIGKKDACLNPACYRQKSETHVQVSRARLAKIAGVEPERVPVVRSFSYSDGEGYLGSESALVIRADTNGNRGGRAAKSCRKAIAGIDIEPDNYGRTVQVCLRETGCKTHWSISNNSASCGGNPAKERSTEAEAGERLKAHRSRREEIWNAKVAEAVRVRVLKHAAESFGRKFRFTEVGTELLPQLIARLWRMTSAGDSNNLQKVVRPILTGWMGDTNDKAGEGIHVSQGAYGIEYFKALKREGLYRILFLLVHGHKGAIGHLSRYESQKEVKELAAEFKADYVVIDAEVRLELSAKKHRQAHQSHLEAVRTAGKDAEAEPPPRLFSERWEAKD